MLTRISPEQALAPSYYYVMAESRHFYDAQRGALYYDDAEQITLAHDSSRSRTMSTSHDYQRSIRRSRRYLYCFSICDELLRWRSRLFLAIISRRFHFDVPALDISAIFHIEISRRAKALDISA